MADPTDDPRPTTDVAGAADHPSRAPDPGRPATSAVVRSENEAASRARVDDLVTRSRLRSERMAARRADLTARKERGEAGPPTTPPGDRESSRGPGL